MTQEEVLLCQCLGQAKVLLKIEVAWSKENFISHNKYIINLLRETGKLDEPVKTPIEPNYKLRESLKDKEEDRG